MHIVYLFYDDMVFFLRLLIKEENPNNIGYIDDKNR